MSLKLAYVIEAWQGIEIGTCVLLLDERVLDGVIYYMIEREDGKLLPNAFGGHFFDQLLGTQTDKHPMTRAAIIPKTCVAIGSQHFN